MTEQWEKRTILVPAGITMIRLTDGHTRTHQSDLQFRAKRKLSATGEPADDVWLFPWLSKLHSVPQAQARIVK